MFLLEAYPVPRGGHRALTTGAKCSILYKYSVFCVGEIG
jgi:hypothetical protein